MVGLVVWHSESIRAGELRKRRSVDGLGNPGRSRDAAGRMAPGVRAGEGIKLRREEEGAPLMCLKESTALHRPAPPNHIAGAHRTRKDRTRI